MRIGIIHISQRPDTWANFYIWELRRNYPEHEVVLCAEPIGSYPQCRWRKADCDIYLRIDDSLAYDTPSAYRPMIYLCSDTHVSDAVNRLHIAACSNYIFYGQKNAAVAKRFPRSSEWLPHRAYYFPEPSLNPKWQVSAAMVLAEKSSLFGQRTDLAKKIRESFERVRIGHGPFHEVMAWMYADSLIVWNHSVNNDVNMRIFEGAAAGACVISSRITDNGLEDIFGDLIAQYDPDSPDECIELIREWLAKPKECRERGAELRRIVQGKYTYGHALKRIPQKAEELR